MSNRSEARTPADFWDVINGEFLFEVDAAASKENTRCSAWIPEWQNALDREKTIWTGDICQRVYCNPPFKHMLPWAQRAYEEAQKHPLAVVALLGPMSRAVWFKFCCEHASEIRILTPRVQFDPPPGVTYKGGNDRDQILVIFRRRPINGPPAHIWLWGWKQNEGDGQ